MKIFLLWLSFMGGHCLGHHMVIGKCRYIVHPVCPDPSINLYLYTRYNQYYPQLITVKNITESYFNKSLPNKFILHGFNSDSELDVLQSIKTEYLMQMNANVWMIDYRDVVSGPIECYVAAVYNLRAVSQCATIFVHKIMELSDVKDSNKVMHLIGFSLGGQLTSYISERLKPIKLPRITGLDPALPLFYSAHLNRRLSRNDADFVDVIHTNALIQGQLEPCGDVDFYMNGGFVQPACKNSSKPPVCNHHMAPAYFAESIRTTTGFWAWPCPSPFEYLSGQCPPRGDHVLMGEFVNNSARGEFVLQTNSVSPYAQGDWKSVQV